MARQGARAMSPMQVRGQCGEFGRDADDDFSDGAGFQTWCPACIPPGPRFSCDANMGDENPQTHFLPARGTVHRNWHPALWLKLSWQARPFGALNDRPYAARHLDAGSSTAAIRQGSTSFSSISGIGVGRDNPSWRITVFGDPQVPMA
jgi:hypothetical protein